MSNQPSDESTTPDTKQTKVEDLPERDLTNASASDVKGGAITSTSATISPVFIIPCVRTIKGSGL